MIFHPTPLAGAFLIEPERRGDERNFALYKERIQRLQEDIARSENNVRALAREVSAPVRGPRVGSRLTGFAKS